jgi:hypothetical protein
MRKREVFVEVLEDADEAASTSGVAGQSLADGLLPRGRARGGAEMYHTVDEIETASRTWPPRIRASPSASSCPSRASATRRNGRSAAFESEPPPPARGRRALRLRPPRTRVGAT